MDKDKTTADLIREKCAHLALGFGLSALPVEIMSKKEFSDKFQPSANFYSDNANWCHVSTGQIIFDAEKVDIDGKDFDRSFCHELHHADFAAQPKYMALAMDQVDEYSQEILCLKLLSEVYVERKVAEKLPADPLHGWDKIIEAIKEHGIDYIIAFNFEGHRDRIHPSSREEWWNVITMIMFMLVNLISFEYGKTGSLDKHFKLTIFHPSDPLIRKVQEFFQWFENFVIPQNPEALLDEQITKKVIEKINEVDEAISAYAAA